MNAKVVLVYGDLAGSVYAATAARQLGLCVVHVEAGRRSRDPDDPEEYNRLKLDRMSGLLLTPSNEASLNLTEEGLAAKSELVGSTAVERFAQALEVGRSTKWTGSDVVVAIHRNDTLHDPIRMKSVRQLAQQLARSGLKVLMLTYSDISRSHGFDGLSGVHRVTMLERLRFSEYVGMMATASCLITDSTGMQDDAYSIGLPTLTMRTHTHCVESIKAGSNTLVGFDLDLALSIVSDTLDVGCSPLQLDRRVLNFDGAGSRVASAVAAMMAEGLCE